MAGSLVDVLLTAKVTAYYTVDQERFGRLGLSAIEKIMRTAVEAALKGPTSGMYEFEADLKDARVMRASGKKYSLGDVDSDPET
jgi:hypothetical protein